MMVSTFSTNGLADAILSGNRRERYVSQLEFQVVIAMGPAVLITFRRSAADSTPDACRFVLCHFVSHSSWLPEMKSEFTVSYAQLFCRKLPQRLPLLELHYHIL